MSTAQDLQTAAINNTQPYGLDWAVMEMFIDNSEYRSYSAADDLTHRTFLLLVAEALDGGKPHTCKWTHDDNDGLYGTECGNAFEINDGTPKENQMAFCCYCGGTIKENRNE